jgi:tetratricopeptide (TPR) repeat protein
MKNTFCLYITYITLFLSSYHVFSQDKTEADKYQQAGSKNLQIGRNDLALENYQKALTSYQKIYGEKNDAVADCYNHLGIVYWNTGNNELALDYLNKALNIRQTLYKENHAEVAASYNDIGLVYASSQPLLALQYYEKALAIYQKVYPENHPSTASAYNNIALIQRSQKQYEEALINFNKTLEIRKLVYEKDHPNEAFAYLSLGQVYNDLDNFDNALEHYLKALKIYQKNYGEKHPEIAQTYNLLSSLYAKRNDYEIAISYIHQALKANVMDFETIDVRQNPKPKNYYNGNLLLNSLLLKAQIYENLHYQKTLKFKDLTTALSCLETCDTLISELRQLRTNKNDKIALGITAAEVYEDAIRLCMQMAEVTLNKSHYERKAFEFAEKSKSAVLLSAISDSQAKEFAGIPKDILENENELKAEITFYENQLSDKKNEQATRNK